MNRSLRDETNIDYTMRKCQNRLGRLSKELKDKSDSNSSPKEF